MNKLVLLCGKPGSGKTTIAKFLQQNHNYIHFSADDFMLKLFGEIQQRELFEQKLQITKELIYSICDQLLPNNDVVLDFGFWTKDERQSVISRFSTTQVKLVYIKLDDDEIYSRIQNRNNNLQPNEYYMDKNTYNILAKKFEEPDQTEDYIIYTNKQDLIKQL